MAFYQLRIVVAEKKFDEFIDSLFSLTSGIRKEQGCLDFSLYRDLEKKVLGQDFEMNISETLEKGSYQLAKKKITLHPKQSEMKGV